MTTKTKAKQAKPEKKKKKIKISYLLSVDAVRQVAIEAAERGVWPATIVEERITSKAASPDVRKRRYAG